MDRTETQIHRGTTFKVYLTLQSTDDAAKIIMRFMRDGDSNTVGARRAFSRLAQILETTRAPAPVHVSVIADILRRRRDVVLSFMEYPTRSFIQQLIMESPRTDEEKKYAMQIITDMSLLEYYRFIESVENML